MLLGTSKNEYGKKKTVKAMLYWEPDSPIQATRVNSTFKERRPDMILTQVFVHTSHFCIANIASIKKANDVEQSQHRDKPKINFSKNSLCFGVVVDGQLITY